ncbi:hypothetical protein BSU04_10295 [Caballeronia sordidicola]|uniref:Uncharacterized protein n=1 Tax=Caballeronia sordidicola TaxID=196367 RepID=A0A226X5V9_CABSO|nr:hypothetical protein BSU04_10295 [Caballeronia sordidicola]
MTTQASPRIVYKKQIPVAARASMEGASSQSPSRDAGYKP